MSRVATLPEAPPPELRFKRRVGLVSAVRELWDSRELIRGLVERDVRARYKQAVLGFAWSILTPLAMMVVFTLVFKRIANVDTGGTPYPLFSYLGLLPWLFFSKSLSIGGMNLVSNKALLNKVYCPREVFPLAGIGVAAVDTAVGATMLVVLFVITGTAPAITSLWIPVMLFVQIVFTLGVVLLFSAVVVYFRDLSNALTIILQLGLFATPVGYPIANQIPESLQLLYVTINPLGAVIEGYRRTVLVGAAPDWSLLGPAAAVAAVWLVVGYLAFKRLETGFADVA